MSDYIEKLKDWALADRACWVRRNNPKQALTEEEVAKWRKNNKKQMVMCKRINNWIHKQNCGHCLACYMQGTCDMVDGTNYDIHLAGKAKGFPL